MHENNKIRKLGSVILLYSSKRLSIYWYNFLDTSLCILDAVTCLSPLNKNKNLQNLCHVSALLKMDLFDEEMEAIDKNIVYGTKKNNIFDL